MVFSHNGFTFALEDSDVANSEDYIPAGQYNPHNVHPWLVHWQGSVLAVVFASSVQDALDCAADGGKLDALLVLENEVPGMDEEEGEITRLGNASEAFNLGSVDAFELPNPPFSFCALLQAAQAVSSGIGDNNG